MSSSEPPPLDEVLDALGIHIGVPEGDRWIPATELSEVSGAFEELLVRIGDRAGTTDRRTIAASFALRFGWSSRVGILPWLRSGCVPDISSDNVSLRFSESTMMEGTAIHELRGFAVEGDARVAGSGFHSVPDDEALTRALREQLVAQAEPVVAALSDWSGFSPRGSWGMLTSSWASHVTGEADFRDQRSALPLLDDLFSSGDIVAAMRPRMRVVEHQGVVHLYQSRASCCRYYLLPQGSLCASCPLISPDEQLAKNKEWMETRIARRGAGAE